MNGKAMIHTDLLQNLPKECILKIISYLDIDSRRALNIYTKIKIPKMISNKISNIIKIPNTYLHNDSTYASYIVLNSLYVIIHEYNPYLSLVDYYVECNRVTKCVFQKDIYYFVLPEIYKSKICTNYYCKIV